MLDTEDASESKPVLILKLLTSGWRLWDNTSVQIGH